MSTGGSILRRCHCRDENRKPYGMKCPKLSDRKHGVWTIRYDLPDLGDGKRRTFRRSGFTSRTEGQKTLQQVQALLNLPRSSDRKGTRYVTELLLDLSASREPIPSPEDVAPKVRAKRTYVKNLTVEQYLNDWIARKQRKNPNGYVQAECHVRVHLIPHLGDMLLDELSIDDIYRMFEDIDSENEKIVENNAARRAVEQEMRKAKRGGREEFRQKLRDMPPYRRPCGPTTQYNLKANLRSALNDAIRRGRLSMNPAVHVELEGPSSKPMLWTPEYVERYRSTGVRPSPVMVWTPEQAGRFLGLVYDHRLYALFHLAIFRGPRRGELCGLRWSSVDLEAQSLRIDTQLTTLAEYTRVIEVPPKADSLRTIGLDERTRNELRRHKARQAAERLRWGAAWTESERVFTPEGGGDLHPSKLGNAFRAILGRLWESDGIPPVRFHDLRHTAATLMLAAGVDLKVIQATLGHSGIGVTANTYTSVLPLLSVAAAEATAGVVPAGC